LTHFLLSAIEQNGEIPSLKRCYATIEDAQLRPVYSKEEIIAAVQRVADEISRDYSGQEFLRPTSSAGSDCLSRLIL
jgi:hypothetical protein